MPVTRLSLRLGSRQWLGRWRAIDGLRIRGRYLAFKPSVSSTIRSFSRLASELRAMSADVLSPTIRYFLVGTICPWPHIAFPLLCRSWQNSNVCLPLPHNVAANRVQLPGYQHGAETSAFSAQELRNLSIWSSVAHYLNDRAR